MTLNVSHDTAKFDVHRHCGSGDVKVLICHIILQDDATKGSYNFVNGSLSC